MSTQTSPGNTVDQFLERAGARLRWRLAGAGPAVVLLHGWALDLEYWDSLVALLAPRFTVLAFDRCGFGLSAGQPDVHRNVDDLDALLDAAAMPRAVLIGMSQGARLAIHFARLFPARTRGLLLDGAPALEAESELPLEHYRQLLEEAGADALRADVLRHPLMSLTRSDAVTRALLVGVVARYRGLDLRQPATRGRAPDLGMIAAPTMLLNGSLDSPARHDAALALEAAIPGAQRVQLPGAGHLAALDDPAAYAAIVAAFCQNLPP
jgi:pimeloyl-ACP methyl ester carboxylesterase